ncbi:cyclase family protein [Xanthomonas sp. AmX2]|uniref:cyclase family protein n=1 Tax=Xanthomonas sp. TaxID=29446 RepID=UPI00197CF48F|nr:cyclase family protein [Xanthomonas sp.]MBN6150605.1 cyclase family protein [Xanthomonas sp.]
MRRPVAALLLLLLCAWASELHAQAASADLGLWRLYDDTLRRAKYIDLTHAFAPVQPVWPGFAAARFKPAVAGSDISGYARRGDEYSYDKHGFVATAYELSTDQYGTQLDPPAHWNPRGATISDLPATYTLRPLVVIDVHDKVARDPGYHAGVADIDAWEKQHGRIPAGAVVMIRTDWSKRWNDPKRFVEKPFPGITLDALKLLHLQRRILFHGHEPLDTDATATLEGEHWLLHHNFAQAEGVTNLDQVPPAGALIAIGYAKPEGGTGGFARYVAIAPPDWPHGVSVDQVPGAPLPEQPSELARDSDGVMRPRGK